MEEELTLDAMIAAIAAYKTGDSRKPLYAIEILYRASAGNRKVRQEIRTKLAAILKSDATSEGKAYVCRLLGIIGRPQEVGVLAALLDDKELSHMARYALQRIPNRRATMALRKALGRLKGEQLVGLINTIGERADGGATDDLAALLAGDDANSAQAAAAALGKIATPEAAAALLKARGRADGELKSAIDEAALQCAQRLAESGKDAEAVRVYEVLKTAESKPVQNAAGLGLAAVSAK